MHSLFLVMAGGAVGSGARYLTGRATLALLGPHYPWGTLAVNLIGGLAMGLLVGLFARDPAEHQATQLLLAVGVLGGFTTFSAFSLDLAVMIERGDWTAALFYALISVGGSVIALFAGLALARMISGAAA